MDPGDIRHQRHISLLLLLLLYSITSRVYSATQPQLMDSTFGRLSTMPVFSLLALAFLANSAVGFLAPSVHVARPAHTSWNQVQHSHCTPWTSQCHARSSKSNLRRGAQSGGLTMEVDPHVLRLQAAELGSRLKVRRSAAKFLNYCCTLLLCVCFASAPPLSIIYGYVTDDR